MVSDAGLLVTTSAETLPQLSESIAHLVQCEGLKRVGINTPQPTENGWDIDGAIPAHEMVKIVRLCDQAGIKLVAPGLGVLRRLGIKIPHVDDCRAPGEEMAVSVDVNGCIAEAVCGGPCHLELALRGMNPERCKFYPTLLRESLLKLQQARPGQQP